MNLGHTTIVVLERITRKALEGNAREISNMLKYSNMYHTGICVPNVRFSSVILLLEA